MKTLHQMVVLVSLVAGPLVACSSTPTRESTGEYIDDSAISNKIRAQLIGDKDLNLFQIDVTTYKGVVQLSGFVNSSADIGAATKVARAVPGVTSVKNDMHLKQ